MIKKEINEERKAKILSLLNDPVYRPVDSTGLSSIMEVPPEDMDIFFNMIKELAADWEIILTKKGKVLSAERAGIYTGEFMGNARGYGYVRVEGLASDIFIPDEYTNGAVHKDLVACRLLKPGGSPGRRAEAEVLAVLNTGKNIIVGTFESRKSGGIIIPDDKRYACNIFIPAKHKHGAADGHKVAVRIINSPQGGKTVREKEPEGRIVEILGHKNDPGVDVMSIIYQYGVQVEFPENVVKFAADIPDEVIPGDIVGRRDFRDTLTITIDGEDAKDLDDAVSVETLDDGSFLLSVHIADVTHYVTENSALDNNAYSRGTSIYLIDRVIPMLPQNISNGICSLNSGVDRLTLSCIMEIDHLGDVVKHEICTSVINVRKRMTYTMVSDILENESSMYRIEHEDIVPMIENMEKLKNILRKKRDKRGSIEFGLTETKIITNEDGIPVDIMPVSRNTAMEMIEEFMIVCNETVAEEYYYLGLPFVYRSHGEPDSEKIEKLSQFARSLGYKMGKNAHSPKTIQRLVLDAKNSPEEELLSRVALRSMKQARYTAENEGHYGLASKYYCHFTAPIRRYPDLQIHRIIKANLCSALSKTKIRSLEKKMPDIGTHCSAAERTAEDLERAVDDLKKVQYMSDKIGYEYDGIISGVTPWGIFVRLPNTVEGMVPVNKMSDYFNFDEKNMLLIGEHSNLIYRLGDSVNVRVEKAFLEERKLEFSITSKACKTNSK